MITRWNNRTTWFFYKNPSDKLFASFIMREKKYNCNVMLREALYKVKRETISYRQFNTKSEGHSITWYLKKETSEEGTM